MYPTEFVIAFLSGSLYGNELQKAKKIIVISQLVKKYPKSGRTNKYKRTVLIFFKVDTL